MIKYFAKKYCVKIVNELIEKLNQKVDVEKYRLKILSIISYLQNLLEYLADGKIDDIEAEDVIEQTKQLF